MKWTEAGKKSLSRNKNSAIEQIKPTEVVILEYMYRSKQTTIKSTALLLHIKWR